MAPRKKSAAQKKTEAVLAEAKAFFDTDAMEVETVEADGNKHTLKGKDTTNDSGANSSLCQGVPERQALCRASSAALSLRFGVAPPTAKTRNAAKMEIYVSEMDDYISGEWEQTSMFVSL